MKKSKKALVVTGAAILLILVASLTAYAATGYTTPADIVASLTGQSVDEVVAEKVETGSTYGAIAADAGVLDEFKALLLEQRKAALAERVAEGNMTQERAEAMIERMETRQANCDGSGQGLGQGQGTNGLGQNSGLGNGGGMGYGQGRGQGGLGNRQGVCQNN